MQNLFILTEEEKNRILNLHESATKRQYLSEQGSTFNNSSAIVKKGEYGDPYIYAKLGDNYYFAKASEGDNPNWKLSKNQKSIDVIKLKIFNSKTPVVKTITPPSKFKLKPELNPTAVDSTSVGRDKRLGKIGSSIVKTPQEEKSLFDKITGGINQFVTNAVSFAIPIHLRIFYDFLSLRKKPFTLSDMSTDEQTALRQMVQYAYKHGFKNGGNVNFYNIAGKMNTDGEKFDFKDKSLGLNQFNIKNEYTRVATTLGNAKVTKTGDGFKVTDIYDFNNYYKHPEKYTLKELPNTVTDSMKKAFSGNLIGGVEQMASYYEKLGYRGFPVDIDVPV